MADNREERIWFANEEVLVKGNIGAIDEIFATDYVAHGGGKNYKGHEFIKGFIGQLRTAIPDLRVVEIRVLVEAADAIAWQRTLSGVHAAEMRGIPPTGKKVEWTDMCVTRFAGDKIAEDWMVSDLAGQLLLKFPKR